MFQLYYYINIRTRTFCVVNPLVEFPWKSRKWGITRKTTFLNKTKIKHASKSPKTKLIYIYWIQPDKHAKKPDKWKLNSLYKKYHPLPSDLNDSASSRWFTVFKFTQYSTIDHRRIEKKKEKKKKVSWENKEMKKKSYLQNWENGI